MKDATASSKILSNKDLQGGKIEKSDLTGVQLWGTIIKNESNKIKILDSNQANVSFY